MIKKKSGKNKKYFTMSENLKVPIDIGERKLPIEKKLQEFFFVGEVFDEVESAQNFLSKSMSKF